ARVGDRDPHAFLAGPGRDLHAALAAERVEGVVEQALDRVADELAVGLDRGVLRAGLELDLAALGRRVAFERRLDERVDALRLRAGLADAGVGEDVGQHAVGARDLALDDLEVLLDLWIEPG